MGRKKNKSKVSKYRYKKTFIPTKPGAMILYDNHHNKKIYDGPHFVRLGDIFLMKDDEYTKGDNKIPDTKCIRYERPVVIISACEDIFTVIPLTSKENPHEFRYKMNIEPGKDSYALFSQITTVDRERLDHRIGTLRTEIFDDIIRCYSVFLMERTANGMWNIGASIERGIPLDSEKLDIIRFYPWHVYTNKDTDKAFIVLELDTKELISLDVQLNMKKGSNTPNRIIGILETFCGIIDPTTIHYIGDDYYINKEYELIGIEDNSVVKNRIVSLIKAMFNMNIISGSAIKHPLVGITNTIRSFTDVNYLEAFRYIMNLDKDKQLYHLILTTSTVSLNEFFTSNHISNTICRDRFVLDFVRKRMIQSLNVMDCNVKYLDFAAGYMPDVLNPIVFRYANQLDTYEEGDKILSDDAIQEGSFHNKNIKWVSRYIHEYIDEIKATTSPKQIGEFILQKGVQ